MDDLLPPKPKKFRPFFRILPKIASDGYCCIYGYLRLCRERGETKEEMAKCLGINFWTLKYHYRLLKRNEHSCQNYGDCLKPVIEELEAENRKDGKK